MKTRLSMLVLCVCVSQHLSVSCTAQGLGLDVSNVKYSSDIRQLIKTNIPHDIDSSLSEVASEVIPTLFSVLEYKADATDTVAQVLIIYLTDGTALATLQMYKMVDSRWQFLSQNRHVREAYPARLQSFDVDCDGLNEILVRGSVGMGGFQYADIFSIVGDSLENVTGEVCGIEMEGRTIEFKRVGDPCGWELEVTQDGPQKFVIGQRRTYRLDAVSRSYKLISDVKVSDGK